MHIIRSKFLCEHVVFWSAFNLYPTQHLQMYESSLFSQMYRKSCPWTHGAEPAGMSTCNWHLMTSVKESLDCWSLCLAIVPFTIDGNYSYMLHSSFCINQSPKSLTSDRAQQLTALRAKCNLSHKKHEESLSVPQQFLVIHKWWLS